VVIVNLLSPGLENLLAQQDLSHVLRRGSAFINAEVVQLAPSREIDEKSGWLNPESKVFEVSISLTPTPLALAMLTEGQQKVIQKKYAQLNLKHLNENYVQKIPVQKFLSEVFDLKKIDGKYIIIGVDYKALDAFSNEKGDIVNGMFVHTLSLAYFLSATELPESTSAGGQFFTFWETVLFGKDD